MRNARNLRWVLVAATCALLASLLLSGCVFSETITEKIYDNLETSTVDTSIPPTLINNPSATITSDVLPRLDRDDEAPASEPEESLPVYTGDFDITTTQATAAKAEYQQDAVGEGQASTEPTEQVDNGEEKKEATNPEEQQQDELGGKDEEEEEDEKDGENKRGEEDEGEDPEETPDEPDSPTDFGDDSDTDTGRKSGGTGDTYHNDDGEAPVIPDGIDEVAAVGNYAVIVSMVSGTAEKSSLVACDEETRSKTLGLLANRGIAQALPLWKGDGIDYAIDEASFDKLVNDVVPDLVFAEEGASMFTDDQQAVLQEHDIDVYYLPSLTSATRVKFAVEAVGKILAQGGVESAEANYRDYLDRHDALVERYRDANGGLAGGFDFDEERDVDDTRVAKATLFIDGWDSQARFNDPYTVLNSSTGVAVSSLGYAGSPISYYLSAGGVLNNAASRIVRKHIDALDSSKKGIVWQFAQNELSYGFDRWTGLDTANYDLWANIKDATYNSDLLWYTGLGVNGFGLGTEGFPAVICKNSAIADSVEEAAERTGQLYFAYPTITPTGKGSTVGYFVDDEEEDYIEASIGNAGGGASEASSYGVYVNPKGLVQSNSDDPLCSWSAGSLESVLEASWAYWRFCDGDEDDFDDDVAEFYEACYGYKLSPFDLEAIKDGALE